VVTGSAWRCTTRQAPASGLKTDAKRHGRDLLASSKLRLKALDLDDVRELAGDTRREVLEAER
jgi:hypothetical protein